MRFTINLLPFAQTDVPLRDGDSGGAEPHPAVLGAPAGRAVRQPPVQVLSAALGQRDRRTHRSRTHPGYHLPPSRLTQPRLLLVPGDGVLRQTQDHQQQTFARERKLRRLKLN